MPYEYKFNTPLRAIPMSLWDKKSEHEIIDTGCDPHKGSYHYECKRCGARDWISLHGTMQDLKFYDTPCPKKRGVVVPSDDTSTQDK